MTRIRPFARAAAGAALAALLTTPIALAQSPGTGPAHAIAMHGAPALGPEFEHLPQADPDAPQGGRLVMGELGAFDSVNPFVTAGRAPWLLRELVVESLMARSYDEPFTLYGLIAETIETPEDRSWVEFHLRAEARFSNGDPITVDDVIFSMERLRDEGRPSFGSMYGRIVDVVRVGERGVRFAFDEADRELPLLIGLMPILSRAEWEGRDFGASLEPFVSSGPYRFERIDGGRSVRLVRDPDHWAADLPIYRGRFNFDEIDIVYFRDANTLWEAFKVGDVSYSFDFDPARWADGYDFPAAVDGRIVQDVLDQGRASGMDGFVFNTRRPLFADRRVREALALAFDFEFINSRSFGGGYQRIASYFSGSSLGFRDDIGDAERALLEPFADMLFEGTLEAAWRPPVGAGDGVNRRNLRAARRLLEAAGWTTDDAGVLRNGDGEAFAFELLISTATDDRFATAFQEMVRPLGIEISIRAVDTAQFQERLTSYDYDMTQRRWALSLSPGLEQEFYWGSYGRETPGTRNYMGVSDPVIDAMIEEMVAAEDRESFEIAVRALDRVLSSGIYVIPFGYLSEDRVARQAGFGRPEASQLYGFWRFGAHTWWSEE